MARERWRISGGVVLLAAVMLTGCSGGSGSTRSAGTRRRSASSTTSTTVAPGSTDTIVEPAPGPTTPEAHGCLTYGTPLATGHIANPALTESSGLVASPSTPGVFWSHNDSGHPAELFAMDATGADLGTFTVTGATNGDWEDIGAAPGPTPGTGYLYVADTGASTSKGQRRHEITIWKVPEPAVVPGQPPRHEAIAGAQGIDATYPDNQAYDTEALFVDPRSGDIYVITKQPNGQAQVFVLPESLQIAGMTSELRRVGAIQFPTPERATGAAVNNDGSLIAVRTYGEFWVFHRKAHKSVEEALAEQPCKYKIVDDHQGEGITFIGAGRSVLLTREGAASGITAMGPYVDRPPS